MKVQSKFQVEYDGFIPDTMRKYLVFCVSILCLLKIIKQTIQKTGRAPALQVFSSYYSPPLHIQIIYTNPLCYIYKIIYTVFFLCLIDKARFQSWILSTFPITSLSMCGKQGGKGKFIKPDFLMFLTLLFSLNLRKTYNQFLCKLFCWNLMIRHRPKEPQNNSELVSAST